MSYATAREASEPTYEEMRLMMKSELLALSIAKCGCFSLRTDKRLQSLGINTFGALIGHSEQELLRGCKDLCRRSLGEINYVLGEIGLALAEKIPSSTNEDSALSASFPVIPSSNADESGQKIIDEWVKDLEKIEREMNGNKE